jgi:arylsulfatase A-like enzyme
MRYNSFHTTALCSPTRAALIAGRNRHSASTGGHSGNGSSGPPARLSDGWRLRPARKGQRRAKDSLPGNVLPAAELGNRQPAGTLPFPFVAATDPQEPDSLFEP